MILLVAQNFIVTIKTSWQLKSQVQKTTVAGTKNRNIQRQERKKGRKKWNAF